MNLKELKKLKEISEGYSMLGYRLKDKVYPSSNGDYMKMEILLEKEAVKEDLEIGQMNIAHLIEEAEETTLPKRYISNRGMPTTLYQYMEILGIDKEDIYAKSTIQKGCSTHEAIRTERDKINRGYGKDTIYKRFELYELEAMIKQHHKKRAKEIAPDLHTQDKDYYNAEMAEINNARDKALNILRWRGL